jgi:hypothetical protein
MRWSMLICAVVCACAAARHDVAMNALPKGAIHASQRERDLSSTDSLGVASRRVYEVEAEMTEAEFVTWCQALGLTLEPADREAAAQADGPRVLRRCRQKDGSANEDILYNQGPNNVRGFAIYSFYR